MIEPFQRISDLMQEDGQTPPFQGQDWVEAGDILLKYIMYLRRKIETLEVEYGKLLTRIASGKLQKGKEDGDCKANE